MKNEDLYITFGRSSRQAAHAANDRPEDFLRRTYRRQNRRRPPSAEWAECRRTGAGAEQLWPARILKGK